MAKRRTVRRRDAAAAFTAALDGKIVGDAERLAGMSLDADFLRTIIEESNRSFFLIDPQTQALVYISPAFDRLWGVSRDEFYRNGDLWYQSIHPDDAPRCRDEADKRLAAPDVRHQPFDYRIFRPDGELRWIRGNVFECRHAGSGERLLCGIAEDVTELKRHEAERAATHAMLEDTIARRTAELTTANEALRAEIERRANIERELRSKQSFLERMLRSHEWDRRLMSLEIHDGAIQNIYAAQLHLDGIGAGALTDSQQAKLAQCRELLQHAIGESRRVINGMRPQTLDDLGLQAALEETAAFNEQQGLAVELVYQVIPDRRAPMIETTIYRLVQEALNNVRRHAEIERARVELRRDRGHLLLTIADAGKGFDQAVAGEGFGLRGLRERAAAVGGEVQIESAPGRGTVVTARLPILDPVDSAAMERDRAAAALETGRMRHQAILDQTEAVVFVKDAAGRYELINHRYESLFHVKREDFIGKTDLELFPRDVAETLRANDQRVLTEGRSITFEESVPSDGEMREYVTVKFPILGEAGEYSSICGIATDITDQKRRTRALEEMRRRFAAFMDNSPMLAWIKDDDGRYVYVNRWMLKAQGLPEAAMLGRTDFELFPAEIAAAMHEHDREVIRTGIAARFQEDCPIASGPTLRWESIKFRMQADDGKFLVGGVALDASRSNES